MTTIDGTTKRNKRIPRSDPMDHDNPNNRTHIRSAQLSRWDAIVGKPSAFVTNPPLKFHYETSHGITMVVRLMLNSTECISWNIELQYTDTVSIYYQLYYWKEPCGEQRGSNEEYLLRLNSRWSDNMTHLRHSDAIDTYNFITEMLEAIGIDTWETTK